MLFFVSLFISYLVNLICCICSYLLFIQSLFSFINPFFRPSFPSLSLTPHLSLSLSVFIFSLVDLYHLIYFPLYLFFCFLYLSYILHIFLSVLFIHYFYWYYHYIILFNFLFIYFSQFLSVVFTVTHFSVSFHDFSFFCDQI